MKTVFYWACSAFLLFLAAAAAAGGYRLQPQDGIEIRAMRWDAGTVGYLPWEGISGLYALAPDGTLMVPLAGVSEAAGRTPEELAVQLEQRLHHSTGAAQPPRVAVAVVSHLPVYVLGDAAAPGAYPFRPGLTAQQALALAGGLFRPPLPDGGNSLQPLQLRGEIRLLGTDLAALENERQRLAADLAALAPEPSAAAPPDGRDGEILQAAQAARSAQSERIRGLQMVLREQIERLAAQIALRVEQIAVTRAELDNVSSLKERGLTVSTRVTGLSNALNELETKKLQLEIAQLTARQQLNRAERDALSLLDDARSENLLRIREVERNIARLTGRLATARSRYAEALAAGEAADNAGQAGEIVVQYHIRRGGSAAAAEPGSLLQPGDTLEIRRQLQLPPAPGQ